ncbi:armadillo-type protein [Mycotypha africana]|uniref:armadillo-type protein n=1 Tax=Mycotypha africana TaxID=64632 RepID=UPI002301B04D|nr:armadillo-type protein [Mycotypha africana]KAI8971901.1 armadillo-type protein [Mycotypha africana]
MPRTERKGRQNKKRGKKGGKKENVEGEQITTMTATTIDDPMKITPAIDNSFTEQRFQAAHFGEVDEELLGYFKNVEQTLDDPQFETAEDQRLFVENVYNEVDGNEIRLSTNYSCSLILEKLLKISDSFQLRVFMDKLRGKTVELFVHRFASHVCQTLLTLAADVVEREQLDGVKSDNNAKNGTDENKEGELLSMEQLVLDACEDIKPHIGGLISQQFASHVIRILLHVLAGKRIDETGDIKGRLRSKKSAQYKKENNDTFTKTSVHLASTRKVPDTFKVMFRTLTTELAINMSETEVRTLSVHKVANPVLQLLLDMQENDTEGIKARNILIDRILWGIVTDIDSKEENTDRDSWFATLIRDSVGSHLLEIIVKVAPDPIYRKIFKTYIVGKLEKFTLHPIANFVIQNLIAHVRKPKQLKQILTELKGSFDKIIKNGKYGVIRSLVDAAVKMEVCQQDVVDALVTGLRMPSADDKEGTAVEDRKEFVNCCMRMWTLDQWKSASYDEKQDLYKFHLQGSLILQGIMQMNEEANAIATSSFLSQRPDTIHRWCFSPVGSRAFESVIASHHVNDKMKKKVMRDLLGKYTSLAKDKFGSHIMDKCWLNADIDMKEKIAAELVKHEHELASHYIGKNILWTCKIDQYKRRHDVWVEREKGAERKREMFKDILDDTMPISKKRKFA